MSQKSGAVLIGMLITACIIAAAVGVEARAQDKSSGAAEDERVFSQSQVDEKAIIDQESRRKEFPSAESCEGHGSVLLRVVLHKSGKVTDVKVVRDDVCKRFVERSVKIVRKLKFIPAKKGGAAVSQYAMFEYNYNVF